MRDKNEVGRRWGVGVGVGGGWGGWGGGCFFFFFFKQKTAYEIVSRDWSSDVCSSDLVFVINLPGEDENRTTVSIDGLVQLQYFEYKNRLIPYGLLGAGAVFEENADMNLQIPIGRSEERRVGKECRSRWSPYH